MYVINNNTCFVVMYFFWNVIYWEWLNSCGLSCDNVFKNLFLSTETVVNSVHNIHADKFNTKNIIENIQDLNVIKRKFTNMLF